MIREVLGSFQIPRNLTENVVREVARLKPTSPSVSKPWIPWGLSFRINLLGYLDDGIRHARVISFPATLQLRRDFGDDR